MGAPPRLGSVNAFKVHINLFWVHIKSLNIQSKKQAVKSKTHGLLSQALEGEKGGVQTNRFKGVFSFNMGSVPRKGI